MACELPRVIAFCGPDGVGKTTTAEAVSLSSGGRIVRFATPLKAMVVALMRAAGMEATEIHTLMNEEKKKPVPALGGRSTRYALRTIGTEWGREIMHPEMWTRIWKRVAYKKLHGGAPLVVVDDLRFPNESGAVAAMGGVVVELRREGVGYDDSHPSGQGMAQADVTVWLDCEPAEAAEKVRAAVMEFCARRDSADSARSLP